MIDVLSTFYSVHYNFGILCIILALLLIYLLSSKKFKFAIIVLVILVAINVGLYKRTEGKSWTITEAPEKLADGSVSSVAKSITFSVHGTWTTTNEKGEVMHWCWVDQLIEDFSQTDVIGKLWGENKSKKMIKASESHADGVGD